MTTRKRLSAAILAAGTVSVIGLATSVAGADSDGPQFIDLVGLVRDFQEHSASNGHPDFEQRPESGFGLYTGNVDTFLGPDGRPVFTGNGNKINRNFTDANGNPIAPHLYNKEFASGEIEADDSAVVQSFQGSDAYQVTLVSATFNDDGTSTWTYYVEELGGGPDISHVNFQLAESHQVVSSGTTPHYDVGVDGSTGYYGIKWDTEHFGGDSFSSGNFTFVLSKQYEGMNAPDGTLVKAGPGHDTGSIFVPSANESEFDSPYWVSDQLVENTSLNDSAGEVGADDTGGVESAESFQQWYNDVPGVNMSKQLLLRFQKQDDGTFVFDDTLDPEYSEIGGFFPIDNDLYGNSGGSPDHNYHFTFELHTQFTYDADADQMFKFVGDDDVWVFVDGKLAIDLGGVHAATEQYIDLNRMGLQDGEEYSLDFFFAERHRTESNFRIETNLDLESLPIPSVSATFD